MDLSKSLAAAIPVIVGGVVVWYITRSNTPAPVAAPDSVSVPAAVDVPGTTQQFSDPLQTVMPAAVTPAASSSAPIAPASSSSSSSSGAPGLDDNPGLP